MSEAKPSSDHFSEPASTNVALQKALQGHDDLLDSIPIIPAILQSLLAELNQPAEQVDVLRVAELVGRDESLAAQCLRMANSPLFGRGTPTVTMRGAVRTLGIAHTRDIAVTSSMMRMGSAQRAVDPLVFWEHSLGCAILSRKLARCVGFDDPENAYLAGLLHDLGLVVNLVLFPVKTKSALEKGMQTGAFLGESEYEALGFTHCQSGEVLARKWNFSEELIEVIRCHHNPAAAVVNPALVAIVALSDRLCRSAYLGMGYVEARDPAACWQSEWKIVKAKIPQAADLEWADFVKDADTYFAEIRELVVAMFHGRN
jgi:putative nucleotidyltransferase with HDIG domain